MTSLTRYVRPLLLAGAILTLGACGDALVDAGPRGAASTETTLNRHQTTTPESNDPDRSKDLQAPASSEESPVLYKIMSRY